MPPQRQMHPERIIIFLQEIIDERKLPAAGPITDANPLPKPMYVTPSLIFSLGTYSQVIDIKAVPENTYPKPIRILNTIRIALLTKKTKARTLNA